MSLPEWEGLEALEQVIVKAVKEAIGGQQIGLETFNELLTEGRIAAYEALSQPFVSEQERELFVFKCVVQRVRKVLRNYLPLSRYNFDEIGLHEFPTANGEQQRFPLRPLVISVLLSTVSPVERLYVLHELLGWEKPPRYCKTRLKRRWQEVGWVRLLTGHAKVSERKELLSALCKQAQEGEPREREVAGFALVCLSEQVSESEKEEVRRAALSLTNSADPVHQLVGLWVLRNLQHDVWDDLWIRQLNINALGAFLESQYLKPKDCLCPSPFCLHHYAPNMPRRLPSPKIVAAVAEALQSFADELQQSPNWQARWRGRLMAKTLGLYACYSYQPVADLIPNSLNRMGQMLVSNMLARKDPKLGLEHALEWLPKGRDSRDRILRALNSHEPIERSSGLYVARGLPEDEMQNILRIGFSDPLVFVRFAALRPMEKGFAYDEMEQELLSPHEHKRLLHRCILNTMARADFERTLEIAKLIYLGQHKEMWREDSWLRHDAGYLLLEGVLRMKRFELLEVFRKVVTSEPRPSPFVLLPAIQAFLEE